MSEPTEIARDETSPPRLRFAPSPTGPFHVGGARSALWNWLYAHQQQGTFILRIEDTDAARNQDQWIDSIIGSLRWLGIEWDEGPYFQSQRTELYRVAGQRLYSAGQAYYCDCTSEQVEARNRAAGRPPGYDGFCRDRELGPGPGRALRFRTPDEGVTTFVDLIRGEPSFDNAITPDFVILKSDGGAIFILANVVDDIDLRITHVMRGEEHLPNTRNYVLLWQALGGGPLPVFVHMPVLVDEQRAKISKRTGKVSVEDYRAMGYLPEALRNYLVLLGWSPGDDREFLSLDEMIAEFSLDAINVSPAYFDLKRLDHFNGEYLRRLVPEGFADRVQDWFREQVLSPMASAVQTRAVTLADAMANLDFFVSEPVRYDPASWAKAMGGAGDVSAAAILDRFMEACEGVADDDWTAEALHALAAGVAEELGLKLNKAQAPVRVAITGRSVGPPLFESLVVLGRERTMARLRAARERCDAP
jgi:glutamyl-tRNA synthetase